MPPPPLPRPRAGPSRPSTYTYSIRPVSYGFMTIFYACFSRLLYLMTISYASYLSYAFMIISYNSHVFHAFMTISYTFMSHMSYARTRPSLLVSNVLCNSMKRQSIASVNIHYMQSTYSWTKFGVVCAPQWDQRR